MTHPVERALNRFGLWLITWPARAWFALALAAVVVTASIVVHPVAGTEQLYIGSMPFGDGCSYRRLYGVGCYNCGMTRSWVFAARGQVFQAFAYNAAGASLFYGIAFSGLLGLVRLIRRRCVLPVPWPVLLGGAGAWVVVWLGLFGARQLGAFALPPDPVAPSDVQVGDDLGFPQPLEHQHPGHQGG